MAAIEKNGTICYNALVSKRPKKENVEMSEFSVKTVSSLEKLIPGENITAPQITSATALLGEEYCYQIAVRGGEGLAVVSLSVVSDIAECIKVYSVHAVPVVTPHFPGICDDDYITHAPALIPDVLVAVEGTLNVSCDYYHNLWVCVKVNDPALAGKHGIKIELVCNGQPVGTSTFELDIIGVRLPDADIPITNWFHSDCIATYHGCEVFSERHWELIGAYMRTAREHGINMILTPVFTPPLDTDVGAERPTVQLVDVACDESGTYTFGFDRLLRWLDLARECGMEYIEISHLFTQWGAEHAPKIIVTEGGERVKKFGWHTDSLGADYLSFLDQLLPALCAFLKANWSKDKIYFHISDEPGQAHAERYTRIYEFMAPRLKEFKKMDAIGSYEFYLTGSVETPVVATSQIEKFLGKGIEELWCYYCCSQGNRNLANRFMAMPSARTRIIGLEMYIEGIRGFLQWGYNFYYSRLSKRAIDPYLITDADRGFPAGDAYSVYPTENGASPSLRLKVFKSGIADMCAAKLLESMIGKEAVREIVLSRGKIAFTGAPHTADDLLFIREKINEKIKETILNDASKN